MSWRNNHRCSSSQCSTDIWQSKTRLIGFKQYVNDFIIQKHVFVKFFLLYFFEYYTLSHNVKSLLWRDEMRICHGHVSSACYWSDTDVSTPFVLVVDEHQVTAAVIGWHPASQVDSLWCCPWCCSISDKNRGLGDFISLLIIWSYLHWLQFLLDEYNITSIPLFCLLFK